MLTPKISHRVDIPFAKPIVTEEMKEAAVQAFQNEHFVLGESVYRFEEEFARFCGVSHAVSISSGTTALFLTIKALGIRTKRAILTTPMSFIATANAIIQAGATPRFVDVVPQSALISPEDVRLIGKHCSAIIPVHLYGTPVDINGMRDNVGESVPVIEDACQAHGAMIGKSRVGSLGVAGCFSFYSTKNMTVGGDGGMVTTNDDHLAETLRKLRDCGRISHYEHDEIGYTARLNTINAAIGRVQLKNLEKWNQRRKQLGSRYRKNLSTVSELTVSEPPSHADSVYHLYVITAQSRDSLKEYLKDRGVATQIHYPIPIHLQPIYQKLYHYTPGMFPNAENHARTALSLPMYPELSDENVDYISETIRSFFSTRGGGD